MKEVVEQKRKSVETNEEKNRTAVCRTARTVVWEGEFISPYPICEKEKKLQLFFNSKRPVLSAVGCVHPAALSQQASRFVSTKTHLLGLSALKPAERRCYMNRRNNRVQIRMNDSELKKLNSKVRKSGLSRESYIRLLIDGITSKEMPQLEFFDILKNLRQINNNLNQIAMKANDLVYLFQALYSIKMFFSNFQRQSYYIRLLIGRINYINSFVI